MASQPPPPPPLVASDSNTPPGPQAAPASQRLLSPAASRFLAGAVSGTLIGALLQPLDVIRTNQQGKAALAGLRVGPLETCRALWSAEGAAGLWKGLGATVIRVGAGAGIYFAALAPLQGGLRRALGVGQQQGSTSTASSPSSSSFGAAAAAANFLAGAAARSVAAAVMSPVAVVKTRIEYAPLGQAGFSSTWGGIRAIAAREGVGALYAGLLPTILRDAPFSGLYFAFYEPLRQALWGWYPSFSSSSPSSSEVGGSGPPPAVNFAAGLAAGAAATVLTQPADVLRTRLQLNAVPGVSVWRVGTVLARDFRSLLASGGAKALFHGGTARVVKRASSTALTWTVFEEGLRLLGFPRGSGSSGGGGA